MPDRLPGRFDGGKDVRFDAHRSADRLGPLTRVDVKRQDVVSQMMRNPATAMELKDVKPGQGL